MALPSTSSASSLPNVTITTCSGWKLTPALAQVGDFFVLDGEHVVRSRYDSDCRFARAEVIHPDSAAPFVAVAELLWNQATDFATWWETHPGYHRGTQTA